MGCVMIGNDCGICVPYLGVTNVRSICIGVDGNNRLATGVVTTGINGDCGIGRVFITLLISARLLGRVRSIIVCANGSTRGILGDGRIVGASPIESSSSSRKCVIIG